MGFDTRTVTRRRQFFKAPFKGLGDAASDLAYENSLDANGNAPGDQGYDASTTAYASGTAPTLATWGQAAPSDQSAKIFGSLASSLITGGAAVGSAALIAGRQSQPLRTAGAPAASPAASSGFSVSSLVYPAVVLGGGYALLKVFKIL